MATNVNPTVGSLKVFATLQANQYWKIDPKNKDNRFTVIEKDKVKTSGASKLLDMINGLKEFETVLQKNAEALKTADKALLNDAYVNIKGRVTDMKAAIAKSTIAKMWLAVVQFFTCKSLDKEFKKIEKLLQPTVKPVDNKTPKIGDYKIQPQDATIATTLAKLNADIDAWSKKVTDKSWICDDKVEADKAAKEANVKEFAALLAQAKAAFDALNVDARLTFNAWLKQNTKAAPAPEAKKETAPAPADAAKKEAAVAPAPADAAKKEAAPAPALTMYDMLDSNETYLSSAYRTVYDLYRYARFAATKIDGKNTTFGFTTDNYVAAGSGIFSSNGETVAKAYAKQFYNDKADQNSWRVSYNDYCDSLGKTLGLNASGKPSIWSNFVVKDDDLAYKPVAYETLFPVAKVAPADKKDDKEVKPATK